MIRVKWEVPSEAKAGRGSIKGSKWAPIKLALIENPNQWALIKSNTKPIAIPKDFAGSNFERRYRKEDGIFKVYARFIVLQ